MNWRVRLSRYVNHRLFGGSQYETCSARSYRERRWVAVTVLDFLALLIFWETRHCLMMVKWEKEHAQTHQGATQSEEETTRTLKEGAS